MGSLTLEYFIPSAMRQYVMFPSGLLGFPFDHFFSDAVPRKHQCLGLNWVANSATSLALWKQVSVFPFLVHSMSLNKRFWSLPVQGFLNLLLDLSGRSTWSSGPNESRFSGCQIRVRSMRPPNLLPNFSMDLDFDTSTHSAESENARTFIFISFAAGSLSNVIFDLPFLQDLHLVCVFATDQYLYLSLYRLYQILCPWKT